MKIPPQAENIIKRLEAGGFTGWLVGGCVRDSLMGQQPHDWDVCTSARPEEVQSLFSGLTVIPTGLKHGTVTVMAEAAGLPERIPVEITTYRKESAYSDGRRPDRVEFVNDIEEDLARRDFTVNAMAWNPEKGLMDPFGGQQDLEKGILRCVGHAHSRFEEDALRIIRALRFMSQKGFKAEADTEKAIRQDYSLLERISAERISSEFVKFLCGQGAAELLDDYREVFCFIIPELKAMIGFDQRSPYHNRDVWQHSLCAVEDIPPEPVLRMTMLLHDVAKPVVFILDDNGRGRFVGHPAKGAEMAETILRRMKYSNDFIKQVTTLIRYHDLKIRPEKPDVRRWLGRLGKETFDLLMYVRHADASGKYPQYLGEAEKKNQALKELEDEIEAAGDCVDLKGLAVSGSQVTALGISGSDTGSALDWLLEEVITERTPNDSEKLLEALKKKLSRAGGEGSAFI